jgi:hypothetical protein
MKMPELKYEYLSFWKVFCKDFDGDAICIAFVDTHAPYMNLLIRHCSNIYKAEMADDEELPMMPYDVKKLEEIGKYITFVQRRHYDSRDWEEINYLIEVFSYIQETMELPDGFLDYYDKVQAEEMLKG